MRWGEILEVVSDEFGSSGVLLRRRRGGYVGEEDMLDCLIRFIMICLLKLKIN